MCAIEKSRVRGDLPNYALNCFQVKDHKFGKFYLLPKIRNDLHNVSGRPADCGFLEIILALDNHLQPRTQKKISFIKDANHYLRKI